MAGPGALAGVAAYVLVVYAVVVLGVGAVLGVDPPSVPLAVVATAVVAVTLEPVRQALHRRFGGSAYDRLAAFGAEMAGAVSPEQVCPRMARLLAEATGARSVEVWLVAGPDRQQPAARWPLDAPPIDPSAAGVHLHEITHRGELLGRVVRREGPGGPLSPVEQRLVADLLSSAGLALRQVVLAERLRRRIAESAARAEQLRASRQRIVATADAARSRLERDVHDGAQQHLVALAVGLRLAQTVADRDPDQLPGQLADLRTAAGAAAATVADLSQGIYPRSLAESGVGTALRAATMVSPVPVHLVDRTTRRPPPDVEAAAYFCCLEAVQNAVKHAAATRIEVQLADDAQSLSLCVRDDGRGLPGGTPPSGSGLANMRDRVDAVGGALTVTGNPGTGTVVAARIPLPPAEKGSA